MKKPKLATRLFQHKNAFQGLKTLERKAVDVFLSEALDLIFPGMLRKNFKNQKALENALQKHFKDLQKFLVLLQENKTRVAGVVRAYEDELFSFSATIEKDASSLFEGDPAASSIEEVLLCYPGLFAVSAYRLANFFYLQRCKILARLMSEIAHERTGIDIHPGAKIGESFFIDHGTGVVIGETAVIGNHVKIYQGVTLGALSVDKSMSERKRHPTIEDGCVIYSHATILGGETVIGKESVIGGNVWMTKSVPAHSLVYHKSEVKLDQKKNINQKMNQQEELTYEI